MSTAIEAASAVRTVSAAADDPGRMRWGRVPWLRRHPMAVGLAIYVVCSFAWFWQTWVDPVHRHAGTTGDPESYIFALAWVPFAVAHHLNPLHTTYLLDPTGANLMWTVPPGFGLVLWPLTATIGVVPTYNLLATLSLAASAWTAQIALRRFAPGELGPFVGGLFYGFSPYMYAHSTGHAMLTVAVLPPLLLLLVHEAFVRQRWPVLVTGGALGLLLVFQLSTFLELVAAGAVAAVLLLVALAITFRRDLVGRMRYFATTLGIAAATTLVLGGYQLWMLAFGPQSLLRVHAHVHPPDVMVADLLEFVVPTPYNVAGSAFHGISGHFTANAAEANAYIGLPLLIFVTAVAVRHWRSRTVRIATVLTAAMAVLAMGPRLHIDGRSTVPMPWALVAHLPLMGNVLPDRLSVFTDLGLALLLAYGIGRRSRAIPPKGARRWVVPVAAVVVVASLLPSLQLFDQLESRVVAPSYFTSDLVKQIPEGSVVFIAPWTTDTRNDAPELWQALSGFRFKMPSGYAYVPNGNGGLRAGIHEDTLERAVYQMNFGRSPKVDPTDPATRTTLLGNLAQHRVGTVIVGPMRYEGPVVQFFTALLGRAPERSGGVRVWYGVDPSPAG